LAIGAPLTYEEQEALNNEKLDWSTEEPYKKRFEDI